VSVAPPLIEDRELSLEELRMIQYIIDQGLRDINDWAGFNVIDQFQTSALRYQLYEMGYCLGAYQGIYTPSFHGYASEAARNVIKKSFTKKVMGFWKWESLWGHFSTNPDPVNKDNIMVTGFLLLTIMLYTANTGDDCFTKPKSLEFHVTDEKVYYNSVHTMDAALVRQRQNSDYCVRRTLPLLSERLNANFLQSCFLVNLTGFIHRATSRA